jgi:phosphate/sulfate permease
MDQDDRAPQSSARTATPTATTPVLRQPVTPAVPERGAPAPDDGAPVATNGASTVPAAGGGLRPVWHHVEEASERPAPERARPEAGRTPDGPPQDDVRAAARASLAAGRSPSLWFVCAGLVVSVVVAWVLGASQGALALAVLLAVSAVARAVLPRGPVALSVRSRTWDTAVLVALALGVGILSQVIPAP